MTQFLRLKYDPVRDAKLERPQTQDRGLLVSASEVVSWILPELTDGDEIGFDPFLFSINDWQSYNDLLEDSGKILRSIPSNLVDEVWGSQRPALPGNDIYSIPSGFVGSTWQEKVTDIRKQMEQHSQKPTAVLLSALEETAWLFNLRGQDIPYNPFFYSYSLLTVDSIRLFVNDSRIPADVHTYLLTNCSASMCVQILDYDKVRETVTDYVKGNDVKVWIGSSYTNYGVYEVIPKSKLVSENYSPVMMTKAVKTEKEQELLKQCHIRDAVAVVEYLLWLENNVPKGTVTEISGANKVDGLRAKQDHFKGPSFGTISAGGLNAALPHYRPKNETDRKLSAKEMYLVDSGGQYYDGTTDITRTVHWGTPSDFEKEAYTRVLMGNIELSRLVFPPRTAGIFIKLLSVCFVTIVILISGGSHCYNDSFLFAGRAIESIARQALWEVGLNFGHGTGHGIGNFFAVHECKWEEQLGYIHM
ncbi:unnamed protein product [Ranitomeya imitator]|uniref:Peptidase M24 domain-containing protein n=1 Tax=Ranitomeya imitator TaxID=111125 RepID=A0ABN9LF85_9NEOB|nr:unnamed protein product [Ranitomeya imitator]